MPGTRMGLGTTHHITLSPEPADKIRIREKAQARKTVAGTHRFP